MKRLLDFDWPKVRLLIGGLPVGLQIDSQVLYLKLFVNFMNIRHNNKVSLCRVCFASGQIHFQGVIQHTMYSIF